jgi:site-specific DNA-cytosine methylase
MIASINRTGSVVDAIDFFCGFGGSSQGIHAAGAEVRVAANHNPLAIECHAANFPNVDHWRADLIDRESSDYMDPAELPPARFAWFSPGCQHHSPANAKKIYARGRASLFADEDDFDQEAYARSERSRVTMSCVLRYADRRRPEIIVVENVVEVTKWGPDRDGSTFAWWMKSLKNLGYEIKCCFFNSQFFPPCPQSRDRIYIVAWRKGNTPPDLDYRPVAYCMSERCGGRHVGAVQSWKKPTRNWPLPQWGKYQRQYVYRCPDCGEEVFPAAWPAYTAIDWSRLGPTLAERPSHGLDPLADATVARIRRALAKFRGYPPIVIPAKSVWGTDRPVSMPLTAQTTQQEKALVTAIIKNNGSEAEAKYRGVSPLGQLGTVTTNPAQAIASALIPQRTNVLPVSAHGQLNALTTSGGGGHALVASALVPQRRNNLPVSAHEQFNALTTFGDQNIASVVLPNAGNTYESGGYSRARHVSSPLFTQHTTQAFGVASMPSLVEMRGGGSVASGQHPVTEPAHTVTAGGLHHGLVSPGLFAKFNGGPGDTAWHAAGDPLNTITTSDSHGLVLLPWIEQFRSDPVGVTEQLATVMCHLRHAVASVEELPLDAITDDDLMQVRFRMLEPDPELRRAMAFGDTYILLGNKTQMTAGLGNAVTPPAASWITERCLATLRGGSR